MSEVVQIRSGRSLVEYDYLLQRFRSVIHTTKHKIRISEDKKRLIVNRYTDYLIKLENSGGFTLRGLKRMNREYRHIRRYPKK